MFPFSHVNVRELPFVVVIATKLKVAVNNHILLKLHILLSVR